MEFEGRVWKSKKDWLAEVPSFDLMVQGSSKKEALEMIEGAILDLLKYYFSVKDMKGFSLSVNLYKRGTFGVTAEDKRLLLALSLRRQREKSASTVRESAERLGSEFPNSYAQYEKGKIRISFDQYEKLLTAANPDYKCLLRVI